MAYKNVEDRKAASKRHYIANKERYLLRNIRYRAEIRQFVNDLKESTPCKDCGVNYPPYVMDFDHLGDKLANVSVLTATGRIGALKTEMKKCEIICANCHRIRTHKRFYDKKVSARSSAD